MALNRPLLFIIGISVLTIHLIRSSEIMANNEEQKKTLSDIMRQCASDCSRFAALELNLSCPGDPDSEFYACACKDDRFRRSVELCAAQTACDAEQYDSTDRTNILLYCQLYVSNNCTKYAPEAKSSTQHEAAATFRDCRQYKEKTTNGKKQKKVEKQKKVKKTKKEE